MIKKAFTLLELVFVIVIIGILSAIISPRVKRATLDEAAQQIASHIRYTQHLALQDNKFSTSDSSWYKKRWQLIFGRSSSGILNTDGEWAYTIFSDAGGLTGNPDIGEIAKNPLNSIQLLTGGYSGVIDWEDSRSMKSLNIGKKYGIKSVNLSGGCSGQRISFDYLGRPIKGNLRTMTKKYGTNSSNRLIKTDCIVTISDGIKSKKIIIIPETGYVYIK